MVVLVIVGMVSGILMQALERVFDLQQRFGVEIVRSQQEAMLADWFRQSIEGLLPDYPDGKSKFKGSERELAGLTANPVSADYGSPAPLVWKIAFDAESGQTQLRYGDASGTPILSWRGSRAKFVYLDAKGDRHDAWPPALGLWPQLPAAIRVEALHDAAPVVLVAVPMGPIAPPPRVRDVFPLQK